MEHKSGSVMAHPAMLSAYFVLSIASLLLLILAAWRGMLLPPDLAGETGHHLRMVVYCLCFGGIGGTAYSIFGLYKHTAAGDFNPRYFYWYLFRGLLGSVLGMIVYFLIQGGLFAFAQDASKNTFQTRAMLVSAAFLAGFSTNQFVAKLKDLSRTLWGVKSHKEG